MKPHPDPVGRFRPAVATSHELVRGRLLARIAGENALGAPHCTLVVGPAGFGKTTLLAQAYRQFTVEGAPAIWLECNEHDADPSQFLHSLYQAGGGAGANMTDPEFNTSDFGQRVAELGANVCLCIDALEHVIATDTEPLLERLVASLPQRARVLLASRQLPNAWFLERELQGLAATIQANDLRLTRPELAELLKERFTMEQVGQVATLTEGWPVAAQLTRLRGQDGSSVAEMLERLAHEGLGVFEYLAHKVLEVVSPDQREFLRVTSVLSAITPTLANALMQRDDGYALMSGVLRLAPIVSVTSDRDFTIRLHPLLRHYMRAQLARAGQEHERALHRRAAQALAATGEILEAVQHALQADDLRLAVQVFDHAGGDEMIFTLGPRRVQTVAETLPRAARGLSLRLRFTDFLLALVNGQPRLTTELLARLQTGVQERECPGEDPGAPWREFATAYASTCADLLADLHDGVRPNLLGRCAEVERLAHLHFPGNEAYLGLILALEVLLFSRHASTVESRRALNEYIALCERNHFAPQLPSVNPQRGWISFLEGDLDVALSFLARPQVKRLDRFTEPELLLAQLSKVLVALIHYERNEIEQAYTIIDTVFIDPDRTLPESWALACSTRALCLEALGRPAEADHVLLQEESQAKRRDAHRFSLIIAALRLELAIRRSQSADAELETLESALEDELNRAHASWLFAVSLARAVIPAFIINAQPLRAVELAKLLLSRAHSCGHQLFHALAQILLARAEDAAGETANSQLHLAGAVNSTARMRVIRPYLDTWPESAVPLVHLIAGQTSTEDVEHVRRILRALDTAAPSTLEGWSMLSERERDVLAALAAHATTKAIARTLGLSPETVKHHLKRIFSKLGVHSRAEALERLARLSG
jgi:LuxR family transcriptional regulator, maltose regulon positive regulatory protein